MRVRRGRVSLRVMFRVRVVVLGLCFVLGLVGQG